jgi:hypothetical protein
VGTHFEPMSDDERQALLAKTASAARSGKFERFKTGDSFDSTAHHPRWLEEARI